MSHTSILFEDEGTTTVTFLMQIFPHCKTFHTLCFPLCTSIIQPIRVSEFSEAMKNVNISPLK